MDRVTRPNVIAFAVGICLVMFMESAFAELPPGAYKELKSKASEVVKLSILTVTSEEPKKGYLHVVCTAKVLAVTRSKSGIKKGDEIRFRSYHWTLRRPPPGPRNPPLMRKGWKGLVYLKTVEDKKDFEIAAYGESFVASK